MVNLRATGMAVPLVQVLWVTAGLWAFTSDAVPINKSDANINRTAVFIFSPRNLSLKRLAKFHGAPTFPPTVRLWLIDLHDVVNSVLKNVTAAGAAHAVQDILVDSGARNPGCLRHGSKRGPSVLGHFERFGHGERLGVIASAAGDVKRSLGGTEASSVAGGGIGFECRPRVRGHVVALVVTIIPGLRVPAGCDNRGSDRADGRL